jgi:hypothetical protein
MNREQRRHPEKAQPSEEPGHGPPKRDPSAEIAAAERPQDNFTVRAKSSGHKKKTADKWNQ